MTYPSTLDGMLDRPDALPAGDNLQGVTDAILTWNLRPGPVFRQEREFGATERVCGCGGTYRSVDHI